MFAAMVVASLCAAAPAMAATATLDYTNGALTFQAGAGESNILAISPVSNTTNVQIYDKTLASIGLNQFGALNACTLPELYKFRCQQAGLTRADVRLGDGTDTLNFTATLPVTVTGGSGAKTITTGPGDDTIDVLSSAVDKVTCGAGRDTVYADTGDSVAADCEIVNPAAAPPVNLPPVGGVPTDTPLPVGDPTGTLPSGSGGDQQDGSGEPATQNVLTSPLGLTVPSLALNVPKPNSVIVPLSCADSVAGGCRGEVILSLPAARKTAGRRSKVATAFAARGHFTAQQRRRGRRIGRRSFKLGAGQSVKLPVRVLLRGHYALASRRRRAKALLEVVQRDAAGKVLSAQTRAVTLRLPKHKWSRKRGRR